MQRVLFPLQLHGAKLASDFHSVELSLSHPATLITQNTTVVESLP